MIRFYLHKGNEQTIHTCEKEILPGGDEVVQLIGPDYLIIVKPRKGLRPTLILFDTNVGEISEIKRKDKQSKSVEVFIDKRQTGISANPLQITQREYLENQGVILPEIDRPQVDKLNI